MNPWLILALGLSAGFFIGFCVAACVGAASDRAIEFQRSKARG